MLSSLLSFGLSLLRLASAGCSLATYCVLGANGSKGEKVSSRELLQRNLPFTAGLKLIKAVESQRFKSESPTTSLLNRKTRFWCWAISSLKLRLSTSRVFESLEQPAKKRKNARKNGVKSR